MLGWGGAPAGGALLRSATVLFFNFLHIIFSENVVPADKGVHLPVSHLLSTGARLPAGVLRPAGALRRPQRRSTQSRPSCAVQTYT